MLKRIVIGLSVFTALFWGADLIAFHELKKPSGHYFLIPVVHAQAKPPLAEAVKPVLPAVPDKDAKDILLLQRSLAAQTIRMQQLAEQQQATQGQIAVKVRAILVDLKLDPDKYEIDLDSLVVREKVKK